MAQFTTRTLAEIHTNDQRSRGIIDTILETDALFSMVPVLAYDGSNIEERQTEVDGDAQILADNAIITAVNAPETSSRFFRATTVIGDSFIGGMAMASHGGDSGLQVAYELQSKARSVARKISKGVAGTGGDLTFNSLPSLTDAGMLLDGSAINGGILQPEHLWALMALVKSKDGQVDFLSMNRSTLNRLKRVVLDLGGVNETIVLQLPNGTTRNVYSFEGTPVLVNDNFLNTEDGLDHTSITGTDSSIYAGTFDDGGAMNGLSFIYPRNAPSAGIGVDEIGGVSNRDANQWRVKAYTNLASFGKYSLSRMHSMS
jgi:hypothetical protein